MTLKQFSERTDWPFAELNNMNLVEAEELLALYGLSLEIVLPARAFWNMCAHLEPGFLEGLGVL